MQQRLKLRTSVGALDFNLGCSGFVYGLALADGLIRTGSVRRVLLITAETYTKYIHPEDRSLRTIFGDGAAATLLEAADRAVSVGFCYGTDGSGADTLLMTKGGIRPPQQAHTPRHRQRWESDSVYGRPGADHVHGRRGAATGGAGASGLGHETRRKSTTILMHQATYKMMTHLHDRLHVDAERMPVVLDDCGNTVSSTIPIVIDRLANAGQVEAGDPEHAGWIWRGLVVGRLHLAERWPN